MLLCSCGRKTVVSESQQIPNGVWNHFEPVSFNFNMSNLDDCFDLYLEAAVDTARYLAKDLPVIVEMTSPNGEHRQFRAYIQVRDNNGKITSEQKASAEGCMSCRSKIRGYLFFNSKGEYLMEVKQGTNKYDINGVRNLKLEIEKSKLEYPK